MKEIADASRVQHVLAVAARGEDARAQSGIVELSHERDGGVELRHAVSDEPPKDFLFAVAQPAHGFNRGVISSGTPIERNPPRCKEICDAVVAGLAVDEAAVVVVGEWGVIFALTFRPTGEKVVEH